MDKLNYTDSLTPLQAAFAALLVDNISGRHVEEGDSEYDVIDADGEVVFSVVFEVVSEEYSLPDRHDRGNVSITEHRVLYHVYYNVYYNKKRVHELDGIAEVFLGEFEDRIGR